MDLGQAQSVSGLGVKTSGFWQALPFTFCVTLDKLLSLSERENGGVVIIKQALKDQMAQVQD